MRPSLPIRIIRKLPVGRRLALRVYNRALMHLAPLHRARTYFGAELDCDVRDMIQATIIHFGAWEPRVSRVLEQSIAPGDTVVDVGANIGYYSLLFAKAAGPDGRVVAVEALPKLAGVVREHAARNGATNVRVVNVAASDKAGELTLYEAPSTNIGMTTLCADRGFPAVGKVPALPLTEILTEDEMARVALIKIDIEGAEVPVVRHLLDNLTRFPRLRAIAVEASIADNPAWAELFYRFRAGGFRAYDLNNTYDWQTLMDDGETAPALLDKLPERQTDILFTRQEI
jgi:FkbM family methyltransferase